MINNQQTPSLQKAVLYARVSSKEQEKEGFSIPAQLKLLNKYAADNRLQVVHEYVDVETAKKSGRTDFTNMVKFLRGEAQGKPLGTSCHIILVEKTDRLYRNLKDWVIIDELNLEIHFVKENVVLSRESRSSEKFMHGIKVLMAKNYIDNLSEETRKGMIEKAEQGIFPSCAPMGYINVECDGKRFIQPDPAIAPEIRKLFELYATGNYSLLELSRKIFAEGFTICKNGKKIPKSVVHRIFNNSIYYGEFSWAGKMYRGTHEPIISKELYERVQNIMDEKGNRRTRVQKYNWAFQGLLTCGHCGCALSAEIKKQRYVYYHCTGNKGKCPEKWVREEVVAKQFGQIIDALKMDSGVLDWVVAALRESHQDEKRYHDERVAALQDNYKKLQHRLDAMYVDKLDGRIDPNFHDQKNAEWKQEQDAVLKKIESHQGANRTYFDEGLKLLELAQRAVFLYEKQDMQEKRRIINFVCSNSIWKDGRLYPNYRQPFDMLAETSKSWAQIKTVSGGKKAKIENWLGDRDSNPNKQSQSLLSCR